MQGMQTLGSEMRVQETNMVDQQRAKEATEGAHQKHNQANKDIREDSGAADGIAYGCGHSSRIITLFANLSHIFSHPTHTRPISRLTLLPRAV